MENRSHALLAGLFALLLTIAAGVTAIWVSKQNLPRIPYELIATSPVTGLSVQSQVRYQGVPVGNVESLRFVPERPGKVLILISIDPSTPVTRATWAEIVIAGVTGISNVELRDDGTSMTRLESSATDIKQIPIRPNFLDRLIAQATTMAPAVEGLLVHIQKIATDENIEALSATLRNVASLSDQLKRSVVLLEPGLAKVPALIDGLTVTGQRVDEAMVDIRKLSLSAQKTLDGLNAPGGDDADDAESQRNKTGCRAIAGIDLAGCVDVDAGCHRCVARVHANGTSVGSITAVIDFWSSAGRGGTG